MFWVNQIEACQLSADKPAGRRRACRRPSFVRPKEAKASPGLKKNLFAYAADARWDELKPDAHPPRQGNSPSFIGLILAPADFSKGRPSILALCKNSRNCVNAGFSGVYTNKGKLLFIGYSFSTFQHPKGVKALMGKAHS